MERVQARALAAAAITVLGAACSTRGDVEGERDARRDVRPDVRRDAHGEAHRDALPFDLEAAVARARRSFRVVEGAAVGGTQALQARAEAEHVEVWGVAPAPRERTSARTARTARTARPLRLSTRAVERSDGPLPLAALASVELLSDGTLERRLGPATERFEVHEHGLEQSWSFEEAPPGRGALVVAVAAEGPAYAGFDDRGHLFVDEATGVTLSYGTATWIDATGDETPVPVHFTGGQLTITVPEELLIASAYPAVLDPIISAEVGVANTGVGPSSYRDELPAVTFDGTSYITVWTDQRNGNNDLFGARLRASDGVLLDAISVPLVTGAGDQTAAALAWNGSSFALVWQDNRSGDYDLYVRFFDSSLAPIAAEQGLTLGVAGDQVRPAIATAGDHTVVTWQDGRSGTDNVYAARLFNGGVLDAGGIAAAAGGTIQRSPAIGCGAAECLITWEQNGPSIEDLYGARFNVAAGAVIDAPAIAISTASGRDLSPSTAFDGTNYLTAWRRGSDVRANRVASADGSLVDGTAGFVISGAAGQQQRPVVTFNGSQYFVAWQDSRTDGLTYDLYGARITTAGVVTDVTGRALAVEAGSQTSPRLVFGGGKYFLVWQDTRGGSPDVYGERLFSTGSVQDLHGISLSRGATRQLGAAVVFDGRRYFVVYADSRGLGGGSYDIRGMRISRLGAVQDPTGFSISAAAGSQTAPDVAWSGNEFLVVWRDERSGAPDIYGARVSSTFVVLDPAGINLCDAAGSQFHASVEYNAGAGVFLVAWDDGRVSSNNLDLYGLRVEPDGDLLDPDDGFPITTEAGNQDHPEVASNGTSWLVSWVDQRPGAVGGADLYQVPVDAAGAVGTPMVLSDAANRQGGHRMVYDGARFFAVWGDDRSGASNTDIYGARVDGTTFAVLDPAGIALSVDPLEESRPAIAVAGGTLLLVWRRHAAGSPGESDLVGQQLDLDGAPLDLLGPFLVSAEAGSEDQPAVAAQSAASTLVAYQRFVGALGVERLQARRVQLP